jgi:hypothetical protein
MVALRSQYYEKDKAHLLSRLDRCRNELDIHLGELDISATKEKLESLVDGSQRNSMSLQSIERETAKIRHAIALVGKSSDGQEKLVRLLSSWELNADVVAHRAFLKALAFNRTKSRVEGVVVAHQETFRWIFSDKSSGTRSNSDNSTSEHKLSPGELFIKWLSSGEGLFHISGKLGSGKSTLMKFLCSHPRTEAALKTWAGKMIRNSLLAFPYH